MPDRIKLFLCAYQRVGCEVLNHILQRQDIADLAVFTHESPTHVQSVSARAEQASVWRTTASVNKSDIWPFQPDVIASVYYRNIIKPQVIKSVSGRVFNLHPSLLPKHRGCSSLTWALIDGDDLAGITYHYIDAGVDTGRIILQAAMQIDARDTQEALYNRAMDLGIGFWPAAFELVQSGFPGVGQAGDASHHPRGAPFAGEISEEWGRDQVERFIRAMHNPPLPHATFRGKPVRTLEDYLRLRSSD